MLEGMATDIAATRRQRTRLTNGVQLLPRIDGRCAWARLMRDAYRAVVQHCGGDDAISELERMSARRISALETELIHMETKFASIREAGGEPDPATLDLYSRLSDTHRRHCESVGWQRRARNVTPALSDYVDAVAE
jgi:hypothetical protein